MNTLMQIANNKSRVIKKIIKIRGKCSNHDYRIKTLMVCNNCNNLVCYMCITFGKNKCIMCCDKPDDFYWKSALTSKSVCDKCKIYANGKLCKKCGIFIRYCNDSCENYDGIMIINYDTLYYFCKKCYTK